MVVNAVKKPPSKYNIAGIETGIQLCVIDNFIDMMLTDDGFLA